MSWELKRIEVHWEDRHPKTGDPILLECPGLLVTNELAWLIFASELGLHYVKPIPDSDKYELDYASTPMFFVGRDIERAFEDLQKMTFVEFSQKYRHSDFYLPPPDYSR